MPTRTTRTCRCLIEFECTCGCRIICFDILAGFPQDTTRTCTIGPSKRCVRINYFNISFSHPTQITTFLRLPINRNRCIDINVLPRFKPSIRSGCIRFPGRSPSSKRLDVLGSLPTHLIARSGCRLPSSCNRTRQFYRIASTPNALSICSFHSPVSLRVSS